MKRGIDHLRDAFCRAQKTSERLSHVVYNLKQCGADRSIVKREDQRWQAAAEYREILRETLEREEKNEKWKSVTSTKNC